METKVLDAKVDDKATDKSARVARRPPAEPAPLKHEEIRAVIVGLMLAMFLGALDQTIVATALPTIGRHFGDLGDLSWVVTAYLLTGTAVTPLYGKLADMHGRRITMLAAVGIFVVGSLACALAPSMTALVLGARAAGARRRRADGAGADHHRRHRLAARARPLPGLYRGGVCALFGRRAGARRIFDRAHRLVADLLDQPAARASPRFAISSSVLRRVPFHPRQRSLDLLGAALMMGAAVALLVALSLGGRRFDWISPQCGALLLLSAVLWGLFAWRLVSTADPFLPLSVLSNPVVRCAALAGACAMGTLVGMTIFVPLYFEVVLHLSASQSGMALIPLMSATVIFSTITGRLMVHVARYKRMPLAGLTIAILALAALAIWPAAMPTWGVLVLLAIIGSGLGSVFPISTVCMQNAVARHQMGVATGAANFFRALFSALVVAVLGAIVLGGLGGGAGMSLEMLARAASGARAHLRLSFRVHGLRAGAGLRHVVRDRHGGARAERPGQVHRRGGRTERAGDPDPEREGLRRRARRYSQNLQGGKSRLNRAAASGTSPCRRSRTG